MLDALRIRQHNVRLAKKVEANLRAHTHRPPAACVCAHRRARAQTTHHSSVLLTPLLHDVPRRVAHEIDHVAEREARGHFGHLGHDALLAAALQQAPQQLQEQQHHAHRAHTPDRLLPERQGGQPRGEQRRHRVCVVSARAQLHRAAATASSLDGDTGSSGGRFAGDRKCGGTQVKNARHGEKDLA